jgi:peptidoglycan/xylan/chitin deacetylase (PgdA/CDA1 family)
MWRLRYAIKASIAYTLYYLGILDLMRARVLRNKAVVLMYHRVLPAAQRARTASHPGYVVSDTTFARHMDCLSRCFTVLSEQQFVEHLDKARPFPDSSCLITFDDGWHDNRTHALPVLRAHKLPAVIYLPVNFIGTRRLFWREALTHALLEAIRQQRRGDVSSDAVRGVLDPHGLGHVLDIADPDPRHAVIEAVQQQAHRRMQDDGALVKVLEELLGVEVQAMETGDTFLSWEDVQEMSAAGISFGAHGVEHRLLGDLPPAEADFEVRESRRVVADRIGAPVLGLTYPNGSVTPAVRGMVEAAGYSAAFTTESGPVAATDDRFMLRRVNVHEDMTASTPMFLARIVGLF